MKKFTAIALTLGVLTGGAATNALAETTDVVREQVRQDLKDWRAAGFDEATYSVLVHDVFSDAYQERLAKYQELKEQHSANR